MKLEAIFFAYAEALINGIITDGNPIKKKRERERDISGKRMHLSVSVLLENVYPPNEANKCTFARKLVSLGVLWKSNIIMLTELACQCVQDLTNFRSLSLSHSFPLMEDTRRWVPILVVINYPNTQSEGHLGERTHP